MNHLKLKSKNKAIICRKAKSSNQLDIDYLLSLNSTLQEWNSKNDIEEYADFDVIKEQKKEA
jgi:hypothetical protein